MEVNEEAEVHFRRLLLFTTVRAAAAGIGVIRVERSKMNEKWRKTPNVMLPRDVCLTDVSY